MPGKFLYDIGLVNWGELRQYTPMDAIRYQLKTLDRLTQLVPDASGWDARLGFF